MISIIIPTYNEEKKLPHLIKKIKENKGVDFEIIVVDNNSKDKTPKIAKENNCMLLNNPFQAKVGLSRNMGARIAKGELFYFIDADWTPLGDDHLMNIQNFFKKNKGKLCGAPILKRREDNLTKKILSIENSHPLTDDSPGAYVFRKDFFFKLGEFGDELGFGEDREIQQKVKSVSSWIKNVEILQDMPGNLGAVYKQGKWYGHGLINYIKSSKDFKPLFSMIFWVAWIPLIIFSFKFTFLNYFLILNLTGMFIISLRYFVKSKRIESFLIPFVKFTRSVGEFQGLFSKK